MSSEDSGRDLAMLYSNRIVKFPDDWTPPAGVTVQRVMNGHGSEHLQTVDLESLDAIPRELRGDAVLHDGPSFVAYVNRLADPATTMWATRPVIAAGRSPRPGTITAVFNDHRNHTLPGWRDATAELRVQDDPDWAAWLSMDGKLVPQKQFVEFLEAHIHTVVGPSKPLVLLQACRQFSATRNAQFSSNVNTETGEMSFSYIEEVKGNGRKGVISLPSEIRLGVFPFAGAVEDTSAYPLTARLRYDIPKGEDAGPLTLGVRLVQPEKVVTQAWDKLSADIRDGVDDQVLMLQGDAPDPLRNHNTL